MVVSTKVGDNFIATHKIPQMIWMDRCTEHGCPGWRTQSDPIAILGPHLSRTKLLHSLWNSTEGYGPSQGVH